MTTISKTVSLPQDTWVQVDNGYSALTMKRVFTYTALYYVGAVVPASEAVDGVQTWTGGAITIRDLGGSKVWVRAKTHDNAVDLILGDSSVLLASASAGAADLILSTDTAAYAAGDVLAECQEIANAFAVNGGSMALHSLVVIDKDDVGVAIDLLFFDTVVVLGTENGLPSISDADATRFLGLVSVAATDFIDVGGAKLATIKGIGLALKAAGGSRSLFVAAIVRGAATYTAAGLLLRLGFI